MDGPQKSTTMKQGVNYGNTFKADHKMIKVRYDQYEGQHFSYFHLTMQHRFVRELYPGAPKYTLKNSGIMFHSQDLRTMPKEQDWSISLEM